ncbi:MAG: hypothetical protein FJX19_09660 [Alphaproteobacteria bacterium]|nr:hypothetical protein [Alphaproteobacteria bacterium]
MITELQERYRLSEREAAAKIRAEAERLCQGADIALEWRTEEEFPDDVVPLQTRYADVAVVGQPERGKLEPGATAELPANVVMGSGRPVIVVPYAGKFETPPCRVLVAWNGTREATRAVHDAMPILGRRRVGSQHQPERQQAPAGRGHRRSSGTPWLQGRSGAGVASC